MGYLEAVEYLYALQKHGIKLGLDNPRELLAMLDNPQSAFKSVHVAGTNGKGSTSAMIASVLAASGKKTGLFTSPHLVSFTERIKVGDKEITQDSVVSLTEEIRKIIAGADLSPTFFEFVTGVGFTHFKRSHAEWAVIETGMGGRLDATNVITPEVSVITRIGLDHKEFLGGSLKEIASEKAGIIKPSIPVVCSAQGPEALAVIKSACREKRSPLYLEDEDFASVVAGKTATGIAIDYSSDSLRINGVLVPLRGSHQAHNAGLAIKACELILGKDAGTIRRGIEAVRWPGRYETVSANPEILMDGAHNPEAALALASALSEDYAGRRITLIMGIMSDKDVTGIMRPLLPLASTIILTTPPYERAATPEKLAGLASEMGYDSKTSPSVSSALDMAYALTPPGGVIVITGSFYTLGSAKEALGAKGVLAGLRE